MLSVGGPGPADTGNIGSDTRHRGPADGRRNRRREGYDPGNHLRIRRTLRNGRTDARCNDRVQFPGIPDRRGRLSRTNGTEYRDAPGFDRNGGRRGRGIRHAEKRVGDRRPVRRETPGTRKDGDRVAVELHRRRDAGHHHASEHERAGQRLGSDLHPGHGYVAEPQSADPRGRRGARHEPDQRGRDRVGDSAQGRLRNGGIRRPRRQRRHSHQHQERQDGETASRIPDGVRLAARAAFPAVYLRLRIRFAHERGDTQRGRPGGLPAVDGGGAAEVPRRFRPLSLSRYGLGGRRTEEE